MTETDSTNRPLSMPERFIPYLERHRIYKLFKDMVQDVIINLPKDHLKHMKLFLHKRNESSKDIINIQLLISPQLDLDVHKLIYNLMNDFGVSVITRRFVLDQYEKHENFISGCLCPILMSEVTKSLVVKDPVPDVGWLMFDHPCTLREARCLQQEGVLPTITLFLNASWCQSKEYRRQDIEGLKFVYKATLKEVLIKPEDEQSDVTRKCVSAIRACAAGAQGPGQGIHAEGAPATYRLLLVGPRGSGRHSQAAITAKHFGLVNLDFENLYAEAMQGEDEIGHKMRQHGSSYQMRAQIVMRRILKQDCIDRGWVLTGYPISAAEFDCLNKSQTPPNRIIIFNVNAETCKARITGRGINWCTGRDGKVGEPGVFIHPNNYSDILDNELDVYFSETLPEIRSAAGLSAIEIIGPHTIDEVQTKIQAAMMATPSKPPHNEK